jgi:hypothetical protein
LHGRDPHTVNVVDLLPPIFDAVPDASVDDIIAALRWSADNDKREADQLDRYGKAKFGNTGKTAKPGDGTIPFKR